MHFMHKIYDLQWSATCIDAASYLLATTFDFQLQASSIYRRPLQQTFLSAWSNF